MAIPNVTRDALPFYQPRYTPDTSRLASIIASGGRDLALLSQARGNNQAEGLMRLASILSGGLEGMRADKAAKAAAIIREQERADDRTFKASESEKERKERADERKADKDVRDAIRAEDKAERATAAEESKRRFDLQENRARDAAGASAMDRAADNFRADQQLKELMRHNKTAESKESTTGNTPVVVQTPDGPAVLDRRTLTAQPITMAGKTVGPAPSAQERMDSRKFSKAAPVLSGIAELSEKINTQDGLIAKMAGGAAKVAAKANMDDDVAEYESLVSMFTPMVARALGHTGVLTEQDVQSVKTGFPRPGDSKSLRDRKMKRLLGIITELEGVEGAAGGAAVDGTGAGGVEKWERGPDGKPRKVGG